MIDDTCSAKVWSGRRVCRCRRKAKLSHEGNLYCLQHYPPAIKEKQDRESAIREAKLNSWWNSQRLSRECERVCAGASLEQLKSLPGGAIMKLLEG